MKREKIIQISFIISVVAVIIGAFLKIMHWELALFFLTFGIAALAVFTLLSIYEVTNSVRIDRKSVV